MKRRLSIIAIFLTVTLCLPTFASCDKGLGYQPSQSQNGAEDKDETKADKDEVMPDGFEFALDKKSNTYRVAKYDGNGESVVIPSEFNGIPVAAIDDRAFMNNKNLRLITIPDSVKEIGDSAFKNCAKLETLTIGMYKSELESIEKQAFLGCYLLDDIAFAGSEDDWANIEKGKDWDKNVGMKTDDRTYSLHCIGTSAPIETETSGFVTGPIETETKGETESECRHPNMLTAEAQEPTCTENGYTQYNECPDCGYATTPDVVPAYGHTPGADATCTEAQTCLVCSVILAEAAGHDLMDVAAKEPTCTEIGYNHYVKCRKCDYTTYEEIPARGHLPGEDATCTEPQKCTACGETLSSENGHVPGKAATCTDPQTCTVCGDVLISAKGHVAGADASCTEDQTCLACGIVLAESLGHNGVLHEAKAPTCTDIGWDAYESCKRCDYTTYKEISATGHKLGDEPTCTEPQMCITCGEIMSSATGHTPGKAATCTEEQNCLVCGTVLNGALGHEKILHEVKAPTCTDIGWDAYETCTRCDYTTYKEIVPKGHTEKSEVNREPTCIEEGYHAEVICEICNELLAKSYIMPALGHDLANGGICGRCGIKVYSDGLKFTSNGDGVTCYVSGIGSCKDNDIIIPSVSPLGETVTGIGQSAFSQCTGISSITIPESVASIENSAFYKCSRLTNAIISEGVTSIGGSAFYGCTSLKSIKIPDSVTSIGSAFYNCTSLESVIFSENSRLTSIGDSAFYSCSKLASIIIPDGVETIGTSAFYCCTGVASVTIPGSVKSIGSKAFYLCTNLTRIDFSENSCLTSVGSDAFGGCNNLARVNVNDIAAWSSINFMNQSANPVSYTYMLYSYDELVKKVVIPDGVTHIGSYAFYNCDSFTSITIPDSVTSIGSYALYSCTDLTSITIPDSVTSIGFHALDNCTSLTSVVFSGTSRISNIDNYVFSGCSKLTNITIPDSVTSIKSYAFHGCTSLSNIIIPENVTEIQSSAFSYCSSLESITVHENNTVYHSVGNCIIESASKTLVVGCKKSEIPTDGSVTIIGSSAFSGCDDLWMIRIPNSVTIIGDSAFLGCSNLSQVKIPDGVTRIGNSAFRSCSRISYITIPKSVTQIDITAFYLCGDLTVYYTGTEEEWAEINIKSSNDSLTNAEIIFNYVPEE